MLLASVQPLAPILAGGVVLFGVGALRPDRRPGPARSRAALLGRALSTAVAVVGAFVALGLLLDANPEQAPVICIAGMIVLGVLGFAVRTHRPDAPGAQEGQPGDEDGGGGQRRREPDPGPKTPPAAPSAPTGPGVPWHEFDDVRAGWDRVPAGRS